MLSLNDRYMEAYKSLDKVCREIFGVNEGITTYINTMKNISDGDRWVINWNEDLKNLMDYRQIRNQYVHEIETSYSDICTEEDIKWLNGFYQRILKTFDPLALYEKENKNRQMTKMAVPSNNYQKKEEVLIKEEKRELPIKGFLARVVVSIFIIIVVITIIFLGVNSIF